MDFSRSATQTNLSCIFNEILRVELKMTMYSRSMRDGMKPESR